MIGYHLFNFSEHYNNAITCDDYDERTHYRNRFSGIIGLPGNCVNAGLDDKLTGGTRETNALQREYRLTEHSSLQTVLLPESVTIIGNQAFKNNINLSEVTIENSKLKRIGLFAFEDCQSLTAFTFPATIEAIGEGAFKGSGIEEFVIPESPLKEIEVETFARCNSLYNVDLSNSKIKKIGRYAFRHSACSSVSFPSTLERIEKSAFNDTNLTEASFPASIKYIEDNSFSNCSNLYNFSIEDGASNCIIKHGAFRSCGFTRITIPYGVVSVGSYAFADNSVDAISISQTVEEIGNEAFFKDDTDITTFDITFLRRNNSPGHYLTIHEKTFSGIVETGNHVVVHMQPTYYNQLDADHNDSVWQYLLSHIADGIVEYQPLIL
jgi:hypothetical protein